MTRAGCTLTGAPGDAVGMAVGGGWSAVRQGRPQKREKLWVVAWKQGEGLCQGWGTHGLLLLK